MQYHIFRYFSHDDIEMIKTATHLYIATLWAEELHVNLKITF